jgi:hypothetical protein
MVIMGYYVSEDGSYHEDDMLPGDVEASQRPDAMHAWSRATWVYVATEADYIAAVQLMLDTKAQERKYDDLQSACTYASNTNAQFKAESLACLAWRDAVWAQCYADLAAVQEGTMRQPTVPVFVADLPKLTWPAPQA